ncbi:MAG: phage tail protein [Acidobacteriota bacterium]|nr:phage tail protein [Acidobacteriota bacterium]
MSDAGGDGAGVPNAGGGPEESAGQAESQGNAQYEKEAAGSQNFSNSGDGPEESAGQAESQGNAQYEKEAAGSQDFSNSGDGPEPSAAQAEAQGDQQYAASAASANQFTNKGVGPRYNESVGISVFFKVQIDAVDLGSWSKCSGLGITLGYDARTEQGMTLIEHHLPKSLTYTKITLQRPLTSDCRVAMEWITAYHMLPIPTTAQITCMDQAGRTIAVWDMLGVTPESWKGPTFDSTAGAATIAMEELSFHHQGFL